MFDDLTALLITAIILGIILAVYIIVLLFRATGNAFDWFINTFGRK